MISGIFHEGSGLGNQLHRYVATRVLALDKGYDFSIIGEGEFKGSSFLNLDFGSDEYIDYKVEPITGRVIPCILGYQTDLPVWEEKTNYYNPEFNFIEDNTIIDGEFQDERYFSHRLKEIDEWLKVEPLDMPNDLCVINFRGGEFAMFPELFLTKDYWNEAIATMKLFHPSMKFEVHTDDPELARKFFGWNAIHDIAFNWRSLRYAKYAIIANSSFAILPRLLNGGVTGLTIAPRYWARRNTKEWSMPQNYYKSFKYV